MKATIREEGVRLWRGLSRNISISILTKKSVTFTWNKKGSKEKSRKEEFERSIIACLLSYKRWKKKQK